MGQIAEIVLRTARGASTRIGVVPSELRRGDRLRIDGRSAWVVVEASLATAVERCVEVCEETLDRYVADDEDAARGPSGSTLLLAVAALQQVVAEEARGRAAPPLLTAASEAAHAAAQTARQHGLDVQLLRCAAALDRAAFLCCRQKGPRAG